MASLITHPIVPIAAASLAGRRVISVPLLILGVLFSMLPDLDSIGFHYGVAYASAYGHRGFSHSIAMALWLAALAAPFARGLDARPLAVFLFLSFSMLSHGVLDAMTDAGNGIAFLWPFDARRIFFDFRPIEASPISLSRFMSARGIQILWSEIVWVWMPLLLVIFCGHLGRRGWQRFAE